MGFEITEDKRKVRYNANERKFYIDVCQVQVADETNFLAMLEAWENGKKQAEEFLLNNEVSQERDIDSIKKQYVLLREKAEKDKESYELSLSTFKEPLEEFKDKFKDNYDEAKKTIDDAKNRVGKGANKSI